MKNLNPIFKYVIATTVGTLLIIGAFLIYGQQQRIDTLQYDLQVKQQTEQRASDYSETVLDIKTIENKFNELQEYPILKDSTIYMDHTYHYTDTGKFGFESVIELKGRGQCSYNSYVSFKDAIIKSSNNGRHINIQIKHPYIDSNSVKKVPGSLVMIQEDTNFWSTKTNAFEAQQCFEDEFVFKGRGYISDLYSTKNKQAELDKAAQEQVEILIKTLNLHCTSVSVDIVD